MKLATVVVTYHPDIPTTIQNILSYTQHSELLIIWNNSSFNIEDWKVFANSRQTIICGNGENIGLGAAYNKAITLAEEHDCTHLMTMDQDSQFENFSHYKKQIETFNDPRVGIFTCPINNDISKAGYRSATVCQSGSIYTLKMLKEIGGFREDFFIGMVDAEMSLRALEKGYKIYQFTESNLIQHIGSGRTVQFLGKKITVSDYSPLRHYYDSRNRILMWNEFSNDFDTKHKLQHFWSRAKLIIKILLFENQKREKILAIIRGTFNGILNQTKPF